MMRTNVLLPLAMIGLLINRFAAVPTFAEDASVQKPLQREMADRHVELLYFYASWCAPCQKMNPLISRLERTSFPVRLVDVDEARELVNRFQVESLPTCILTVHGDEADRLIGLSTEQDLQSRIRRVINGLSQGKAGTPHSSDSPREDLTLKDSTFDFDQRDADFDREARALASRLRIASSDERPQLLKSLQSLNERHFEHRQSRRQAEIDQLASRVDGLKQLLQRRQSNKADVLQRRMKELSDPNADLNWLGDQLPKPAVSIHQNNRTPEDRPDSVPITSPTEDKGRSSDRNQSTYQGVTLESWLATLETERSPEKLTAAAKAVQYLNSDADPQLVLRSLMKMTRARPEHSHLQKAEYELTIQVVELLGTTSPEPVVTALIEELQRPVTPNQTFQNAISFFVACVNNAKEGYPGDNRYRFENSSPESSERMRQQLRRHSRTIIRLLMNIAEREPAHGDWAFGCSTTIVRLSRQRVTAYPELVPVANRIFNDTKSDQRGLAADLLATAGIDSLQVLQFCIEDVEQIKSGDTVGLERWARRVSLLAPHQPQMLSQLVEQLARQSLGNDQREAGTRFLILVQGLGSAGARATAVWPTLVEIANLADLREDLRKAVRDAIQQIELPPPNVEEEPLPVEIPPTSGTPSETLPQSQRLSAEPREEQTYDGIGYREWLRLLESERKPEKLAAAITATARLAEENDSARIIHGILHAAMLADPVDETQSSPVWAAAFEAVKRLPPDQIVDELLKSLTDTASIKSDRIFSLMILIYVRTPGLDGAIKSQAPALIAKLVQLTPQASQRNDMILAAASRVWSLSARHLTQFEDLQRQLVVALQNGPNQNELSTPGYGTEFWFEMVKNVVQHAPHLPNLAANLLKHARRFPVLFNQIGALGTQAEVVVPDLVLMFLADWKRVEAADRRYLHKLDQELAICTHIARTLGQISVGDKGFQLLRELSLTEPPVPKQGWWRQVTAGESKLTKAVYEALKSSTRTASPPAVPLLNDISLLQGQWNVNQAQSFPPLDASTAILRDSQIVVVNADWTPQLITGGEQIWVLASQFEIDPSTTPKSISIYAKSGANLPGQRPRIAKGTLRRGIYELTETTLKIELAAVDQPAPTDFTPVAAELPSGHTKLELEREFTLTAPER